PQTLRQLQRLLTNPTQQEIQYQKPHRPHISPLLQPPQHNILSSITTLPTPHNPTHPSHKFPNHPIVRQIPFHLPKKLG
ncbi:lipase-like domain-containing protein, partial [Staphylococcus saprophyticus]